MFRSLLALTVCALIVVPRSAAAADFGFRDIVALIDGGRIQRIEHLIRRLPDELRRNYVLMAETKSSHQATAVRPRVILASPDARLLVAFSGAPNDPAYDRLELIQFQDETDTFEFREIVFRRDRKPEVSPPNPSRCAGCHQESLRPNWEPGLRWKGAIGQAPFLDFTESNQLKSFSKLQDERYGTLLRKEATAGVEAGRPSAASRLATQINKLNTRRIARQLFQLPSYERHKFAIVAALVNSPYLTDMLPSEPERGVTNRRLDARRAELKAKLEKTVGWWQTAPQDADGIAKLQLLLEWESVEHEGLSTSFDNGAFLTDNSRVDFAAVLTRLFELDPELSRAAALPNNWENWNHSADDPTWNECLRRLEKWNWQAQQQESALRTAAR